MAEPLPTLSQRQTWKRGMSLPISLTSSHDTLTEELQCSICLDVFTDPITTPCGHSFCKICLNSHWDSSQDYNCPICKEKFNKRPDLKINTALREVLEIFKKKLVLRSSEVLCDICDERKMKALKSCLVCQSSYCEIHLEPHQRVPRLKKHKLINAVENLEDYICQKHQRPLELFCRDDQMCVCLSCTEGDHKTHNTVPVEEEGTKIKTYMMKTQRDVQQMITDRMEKIKDIQHSAELRKKNTEREIAYSITVFTGLICSIERCQSELLEVMEQKQKTAETQAEELIKELEQDITELKSRDTELEQLSHTEDHLQLIQIYPSLCSPLDTKNWTGINIKTHLSVETLRRALIQLQDTLDEKLSESVLRRMQEHSVDVTLDPNTAQPFLVLSADGKHVRDGDIKYDRPNNPERFDFCPNVLGKEGFTTGRFYYEVLVTGKTKWDLGVAKESINRKGEIILTPVNGFWTVGLRTGNMYKARETPSVSLSLKVKPEKVGVFVDYEEGLVSFYDVNSKSHIYSFTGQSFTEKLYPYFSPCVNSDENTAPMIISPVNYNE